jgi:hypothetical protein
MALESTTSCRAKATFCGIWWGKSLPKKIKKCLTNTHSRVIIKAQKGKEIKTMNYFYEIKNTKTQETTENIAPNFGTACQDAGWRPQDCKCIWKAKVENGY